MALNLTDLSLREVSMQPEGDTPGSPDQLRGM